MDSKNYTHANQYNAQRNKLVFDKLKFNLLATLLCFFIFTLFSALAETTSNDKGLARQQLLKLSPTDSYLKIRDLVTNAKRSIEIAPFVSYDLAHLLHAISKSEKEDSKTIDKIKDMITAFPGDVRIIDKHTAGQISVLKVVPGLKTGWVEERRSDYEFALVTMNFDSGVWKFKNVELKKISPWCLKATELAPPDVPLHARILGIKYHTLDTTLAGDSINFRLETTSSHEQIILSISAEKFSNLKKRLQNPNLNRKGLVFKRPHKIDQNSDIVKFHPQIVIIGKDKKELLGVKTGLGVTLKFQNYQISKIGNKTYQSIDGEIFLRLPDKHKSYLEGHFKVTL